MRLYEIRKKRASECSKALMNKSTRAETPLDLVPPLLPCPIRICMMDSLFDNLPEQTQLLIDEAFDRAMDQNSGSDQPTRPSGKSPMPGTNDEGGGFIVDDNAEMSGGSFLVENVEKQDPPLQQIPIRLIPSALQLLDLPPDDEEILSVFKNAAFGWASSSINAFADTDAQEKYVTRDDWRSVCAVLLDSGDNAEGTSEGTSEGSIRAENEDYEMESDYTADQASPANDSDSDEEYRETKKPSARRGKSAQHSRDLASTRLISISTKATKRQRETCLNTFALFFPDASSSELPKQIIKVTDLQRLFKLLGEKIKAEEVLVAYHYISRY